MYMGCSQNFAESSEALLLSTSSREASCSASWNRPTCGLCKCLTLALFLKCLRNTAWPKNANGSEHGTYGRHLTSTGQLLRNVSSREGPLEGIGRSTMHCLAELVKAPPGGNRLSTGAAQVLQHWEHTKAHYLSLQQGWSLSALDMTEFYRCFDKKDKAIQTRIDELQGLKVQVWHTRKGVYRKKQYSDVRDERNAHTED